MLQGSNKGNRKKYLDDSLNLICKYIGSTIKISSYFESTAWNMKNETMNFYNRVLQMNTIHSPIFLLDKILSIEYKIGRTCIKKENINNRILGKKKLMYYENREIDIDILFYDNIILNSPVLTIPHPMLHLRRFVLVPMSEINPKKSHPVFNMTIIEILGACSDTILIKKLINHKS